jgi:hypothetical protein
MDTSGRIKYRKLEKPLKQERMPQQQQVCPADNGGYIGMARSVIPQENIHETGI